jgi:malate synthase
LASFAKSVLTLCRRDLANGSRSRHRPPTLSSPESLFTSLTKGIFMSATTTRAGLHVATSLAAFVEGKALPGTGISADALWAGLADILARFVPINRALLAKRDDLQAQIDAWHRAHPAPFDQASYEAFLRKIGYLVPEPAPFAIGTTGVDAEIATMAGPQLVVPSLNDRFVLSAHWPR